MLTVVSPAIRAIIAARLLRACSEDTRVHFIKNPTKGGMPEREIRWIAIAGLDSLFSWFLRLLTPALWHVYKSAALTDL